MIWNLRLTAAKKGIWKAAELQRKLAEHGLVVSTAKMSGLWSGQPLSIKLKDLDVICAVLDCEVGDLLIPEPEKVAWRGPKKPKPAPADEASAGPSLIPRQPGVRPPLWTTPLTRRPDEPSSG